MASALHISAHALERAMERIPGVTSAEEARAVLSSKTIMMAIEFGARFVRLGTGQRVLVEDDCVVTVLPAEYGMKPRWRD